MCWQTPCTRQSFAEEEGAIVEQDLPSRQNLESLTKDESKSS
jgi:hypothetical protein